jgi:hypothetical protein
MCKLRQRGQEYGGPGSREIDPSLQPLPFAAIAGAVLYGRAAKSGRPLIPDSSIRLASPYGLRSLIIFMKVEIAATK